jgi:hypothetical protein
MTRMRGSPTTNIGARVPVEYIGLARLLRDRIGLAHARAAAAGDALIRPLRPKPNFTPMPRHEKLRELVSRWRALPNFNRCGGMAEFADGVLRIVELHLCPVRMRFATWNDDGDELAVALRLRLIRIAPPHFAERDELVADIGLHALARRFERGADRDDAAVLSDVTVLGPAWRAAAEAGGEFGIAVPSGGRWIGSVTRVRGEPVLAVRTFV